MSRLTRLTLLATAGSLACLSTGAEATDCTISPQSVAFGSYDPLSPVALDGVGNIAISCSAPTSFSVSIAPSGAAGQRAMSNGASAIQYNLYTDSGRMLAWGEGTGSGEGMSGTSQNANLTVYGRIPPRQNLPAGLYTDTIVVAVSY